MTACSPGSEFREAHISVHLPSWPIPPLPHAREATSLPPAPSSAKWAPVCPPRQGKLFPSLWDGGAIFSKLWRGPGASATQGPPGATPTPSSISLSSLSCGGQAPTGPCFLSHCPCHSHHRWKLRPRHLLLGGTRSLPFLTIHGCEHLRTTFQWFLGEQRIWWGMGFWTFQSCGLFSHLQALLTPAAPDLHF